MPDAPPPRVRRLGTRRPPSRQRRPGDDLPPAVRRAGGYGARLITWCRRHDDGTRLIVALLLIGLGLIVIASAAVSDVYLHRGVETGAETPVVMHQSSGGLATNADLTSINPGQLDAVGAVLEKNGFQYVRQLFSWAAIEPAKGSYDWSTYDPIVSGLTSHNIQLVAVLADSPAWARTPETKDVVDAPPATTTDFANFAGQLIQHYGDKIKFVQMWDLPNRPDHWGGSVQPVQYVTLEAEAANAVRKANGDVQIVLAELDPAPPAGGMSDISFLNDVYRAGGKLFFDIVAARVDGGGRSPYDRRVAEGRLNLSRAELFRSVLDRFDDQAKPIWATHYGWRTEGNGSVSPSDQADYTVAGLNRARSEWPWMGEMFMWNLLPASNGGGYALLNPDGTATPLFTALSKFAASGVFKTAGTGFAPVNAASMSFQGNWNDQHLSGRILRTTTQTGATMTFRFHGTGLVGLLRQGPNIGTVEATLDGDPFPLDLSLYRTVDSSITLAKGLTSGDHVLTLKLTSTGELTTGGMVVIRAVPVLWPVVVLTLAGALLIFGGLREVIYVTALHAGVLERRRAIDFRPALPPLPNWRPSRRV